MSILFNPNFLNTVSKNPYWKSENQGIKSCPEKHDTSVKKSYLRKPVK